jgi:A/G-specific adenine glycosylase
MAAQTEPSATGEPDPVCEGGLHRQVIDWFVDNSRPLPWRAAGTTPWGVLVSEVMAQQTPVARVAPVWQEWMRRWPTPADLAAATSGDAVRAWGRLGYPRRALRLHAAAVEITRDCQGRVPDDLDVLRALPGVGEYTAAAVAAFAFGQRHPVVDTNVRRVLTRAILGRAAAAPTLTRAEMNLARGALPAERSEAASWSVAVMELGALVCTARSPDCSRCPIEPSCRWRLRGSPADDGPPRRSQPWHGSDRQARGRLLAVVRESRSPVPLTRLDVAWNSPEQRDRALESLLDDGLLVRRGDRVGLPDREWQT